MKDRKKELEKEIERLRKEVISFDGEIIIRIKNGGFFIPKNKDFFVKNTIIDRNRAELKGIKEEQKRILKIIDGNKWCTLKELKKEIKK